MEKKDALSNLFFFFEVFFFSFFVAHFFVFFVFVFSLEEKMLNRKPKVTPLVQNPKLRMPMCLSVLIRYFFILIHRPGVHHGARITARPAAGLPSPDTLLPYPRAVALSAEERLGRGTDPGHRGGTSSRSAPAPAASTPTSTTTR